MTQQYRVYRYSELKNDIGAKEHHRRREGRVQLVLCLEAGEAFYFHSHEFLEFFTLDGCQASVGNRTTVGLFYITGRKKLKSSLHARNQILLYRLLLLWGYHQLCYVPAADRIRNYLKRRQQMCHCWAPVKIMLLEQKYWRCVLPFIIYWYFSWWWWVNLIVARATLPLTLNLFCNYVTRHIGPLEHYRSLCMGD